MIYDLPNAIRSETDLYGIKPVEASSAKFSQGAEGNFNQSMGHSFPDKRDEKPLENRTISHVPTHHIAPCLGTIIELCQQAD